MPYINVHKAFNLLLSPSDKPIPFAVGVHGPVDEEIADHWYTRLHARKLKTDEPLPQAATPLPEPGAAASDVPPAAAVQIGPEADAPPPPDLSVLPEDWKTVHWMKRMAWAKALGAPPELVNNEQFTGYIQSLLDAQAEPPAADEPPAEPVAQATT